MSVGITFGAALRWPTSVAPAETPPDAPPPQSPPPAPPALRAGGWAAAPRCWSCWRRSRVGVLAWALRTAAGSAWVVTLVPQLTVVAPSGSLLGDFSAERIDITLPGTSGVLPPRRAALAGARGEPRQPRPVAAPDDRDAARRSRHLAARRGRADRDARAGGAAARRCACRSSSTIRELRVGELRIGAGRRRRSPCARCAAASTSAPTAVRCIASPSCSASHERASALRQRDGRRRSAVRDRRQGSVPPRPKPRAGVAGESDRRAVRSPRSPSRASARVAAARPHGRAVARCEGGRAPVRGLAARRAARRRPRRSISPRSRALRRRRASAAGRPRRPAASIVRRWWRSSLRNARAGPLERRPAAGAAAERRAARPPRRSGHDRRADGSPAELGSSRLGGGRIAGQRPLDRRSLERRARSRPAQAVGARRPRARDRGSTASSPPSGTGFAAATRRRAPASSCAPTSPASSPIAACRGARRRAARIRLEASAGAREVDAAPRRSEPRRGPRDARRSGSTRAERERALARLGQDGARRFRSRAVVAGRRRLAARARRQSPQHEGRVRARPARGERLRPRCRLLAATRGKATPRARRQRARRRAASGRGELRQQRRQRPLDASTCWLRATGCTPQGRIAANAAQDAWQVSIDAAQLVRLAPLLQAAGHERGERAGARRHAWSANGRIEAAGPTCAATASCRPRRCASARSGARRGEGRWRLGTRRRRADVRHAGARRRRPRRARDRTSVRAELSGSATGAQGRAADRIERPAARVDRHGREPRAAITAADQRVAAPDRRVAASGTAPIGEPQRRRRRASKAAWSTSAASAPPAGAARCTSCSRKAWSPPAAHLAARAQLRGSYFWSGGPPRASLEPGSAEAARRDRALEPRRLAGERRPRRRRRASTPPRPSTRCRSRRCSAQQPARFRLGRRSRDAGPARGARRAIGAASTR